MNTPSATATTPKAVLFKRSPEAGFSLVELLAAMLGTVVVLGAASGFLLTAFLRERAVLDAERLETFHDGLAQDMGRAVKTAEAVQIFHAGTGYREGFLAVGARAGNALVCVRHDDAADRVETAFELVGDSLNCTTRVGAAEASTRAYPHVRLPAGAAEVFSMDRGVVQAAWNVETPQDLVPFHVCAEPLTMR